MGIKAKTIFWLVRFAPPPFPPVEWKWYWELVGNFKTRGSLWGPTPRSQGGLLGAVVEGVCIPVVPIGHLGRCGTGLVRFLLVALAGDSHGAL